MNGILLATLVLVMASCDGTGNGSPGVGSGFYPASAPILSDLRELDSLPVAVIRYREATDGWDTTILDKAEFRRFALKAIEPDISRSPLKDLYKEEVFTDLTLGRNVIRYTTDDRDAEVRLLEFTFDPERERARSVYLEKQGRTGDTLVTTKMLWTVGSRCRATLIRQVGDTPLPTVMERYEWGLAP